MEQVDKPAPVDPGALESELRRQVEQLSYLPASAAVAIKFIGLGKDPDAGPVEYERTISSDPALGTKVLALANSSWFGVRHRVNKVLHAITLLGLSNVRTLAISYCMTGLHNQLKIPREEVNRYWQASLCKGVAGKTFASAVDPARADEAFLAGLFQDIAMPVIHSVAKKPLLTILAAPDCSTEAQVTAERRAFGVDHTEVGRWLATKLELPEGYVDAIGFHHDSECLDKFIKSDPLANAIQAAALFPHLPDRWSPMDARTLAAFLADKAPGEFKDRAMFLALVQKEFDALYGYFEPDRSPDLRLEELIAQVCEEIADSTTRMVGQVHSMMTEAAETGEFVQNLVDEHERVVDESRLDALTGILNRAGFLEDAAKAIYTNSRYAAPFALLYCDVDDFKRSNDTYGHHFGDFVLREVCSRIRDRLRKRDVFGRLGGDEFAIVLSDVREDRAREIVDRIARGIREEPFVKGKVTITHTMSIGLLWVPGSRAKHDLATLLKRADTLMYQSKRSGTAEPAECGTGIPGGQTTD